MFYFSRSYSSSDRWEKKLPKPLYIILGVTAIITVTAVGVCSCFITDEMDKAANNVLELYDWQDNLHEEMEE